MGQFLVKITYTKDFPGIGKQIREYRRQSDKPLAELAAEAGISVPHWNRVENEKVGELPLETLRGIEKALGVDLGVRFDDSSSSQ
jgi:transcriptional regulator with XRE-family HTH domain